MQHLNENARLKEVIAVLNELIAHQGQEVPVSEVSTEIPVNHVAQIEYADAPQADPTLAPATLVWQKSHSGDVFRSIDNTTGEVTSYNRQTLPEEGKIALGLY